MALRPKTFPACCFPLLYRMTLAQCLGPTSQSTDHRHSLRAAHYPVCLVPARDPSTACALLEFAEAPTHILTVLYSVDIGITTAKSSGLDIAAFVLSSPTIIQMLTLISPQISTAQANSLDS